MYVATTSLKVSQDAESAEIYVAYLRLNGN